MAELSANLSLEMARVLPVARPVAFAWFTDPNLLASWWGPKGFQVPLLEFAPSPGGTYRIEMQPPEGNSFHLVGKFVEVDPPVHISYTFRWLPPDPDDVETAVDLSFGDLGDATGVDLEQGSFKTEARLDLHRAGWTESFERLEALLA